MFVQVLVSTYMYFCVPMFTPVYFCVVMGTFGYLWVHINKIAKKSWKCLKPAKTVKMAKND